ncbi:MAG TPA: lipopolysaccharide assembly protein LapA domain-containing protein [Patescibacteria group bacterium]|nr:lipopolysaccharide assembly protein LapA domain-containing protein [Patescibacteria group bacterium]
MRLLTWLIGLPVGVVVVIFALSNRQTTALGLWPFADGVAVPVYVAVLAPLLAGLLLGLLLTGFSGLRRRAALRFHTHRVRALEREVETLRAARAAPSATPPDSAPAGDVILPP